MFRHNEHFVQSLVTPYQESRQHEGGMTMFWWLVDGFLDHDWRTLVVALVSLIAALVVLVLLYE